jgi:hypothetical protein
LAPPLLFNNYKRMIMRSKIRLFVMGLCFSLNLFAESNGGLTRVVRETCDSFPKITPVQKMKKDVHYSKDSECYGYKHEPDGSLGSCIRMTYYIILKYFYTKNTIVEYYDRNGKLVTTSTEKTKLEISSDRVEVPQDIYFGEPVDTGYLLEGVQKLEEKIEETIFERSLNVCKDSNYK